MSQRTGARRPLRSGLTLLEVIVVLALMGLVLAIAAPAFIVPASQGESEIGAVVLAARRAAILRAEPVTLAVDQAGSWRVDSDATPGAPPIATGHVGSSAGQGRVRISPLGTCVPESTDGGASATRYATVCADIASAARTAAR